MPRRYQKISKTSPDSSGQSEGHGPDTDTRLNAAAVTQSVTLALTATQAAGKGTPESASYSGIPDAFDTPHRGMRKQHWIHVDVPRSPEIQPAVNEAVCIATSESTDNGYTDTAAGCISCQSTKVTACLRDIVDSTDNCSVPLAGSSGSQCESASHPASPVLKVDRDDKINFEQRSEMTKSAGGTCDLHLPSQLLPCPPGTINEGEKPGSD